MEIVWIILGILVYIAIGHFVYGFGFDDDSDFLELVFCVMLWPIVLIFALAFGLGWLVTNVLSKPFEIFVKAGQFVSDKVEGMIERRKNKKNKHSTEPRIEQDTSCDKCEYLEDCISEENVIECTKLEDSRRHYIRSFGCGKCRKVEEAIKEFEEMRGE